MLVVNKGHSGLILTEYNGKRFAFHQNIPVEIPAEVYNEIVLSGHVDASDIVPVEGVIIEDAEVEVETSKQEAIKVVKVHHKKRGRPRK